jgi:hypothetical protein
LYREALAKGLWDIALNGKDAPSKLAAMKYIFDRIDGKPIETVSQEITGPEGSPLILLPKKDIPQDEPDIPTGGNDIAQDAPGRP